VTKPPTHGESCAAAGWGNCCVDCRAGLFAFGYQDLSDRDLRPYVHDAGAVLGRSWRATVLRQMVYGAITGRTGCPRSLDALPLGLILADLAAPGAGAGLGGRVADLTELWAAFGRGLTVGEKPGYSRHFEPAGRLPIIFAIVYC